MKKLILILILIVNWQLAIDNCFAQAPNSFSYQAVVRNNSGVAMPNQLVNFRISIVQGSANGSVVYSETKQLTTSSGGLADFSVGTGTVVTGTMAAINWSTNTHFLKIELDATGGNSFVLMGTSQLMSVPYALDAKKAESLPIPFIVNENNSNTLLDVTNSGAGFAIKGSNSNTSGFTRGVQGNSSSPDGTGVFGIATATTGATIGVAGLSSSPGGTGVSALNNSTTGSTSGIAATAYSPDGVAGYFTNPATGGHAIVTDEGDVKIGDLSGTGTRIVVADPNGKLSTQAVPGSQWSTNGNDINNSNTGNVGIGTNTPTAKEEIQFNSSIETPQLKLNETGVDNYSRLTLSNASSVNAWTVAGLNTSTPNNDRLNFYHNTGGDILQLSGDGKVGINMGNNNLNIQSGSLNVNAGSNSNGIYVNGSNGNVGITSFGYGNLGRGISTVAFGRYGIGISAEADSTEAYGVYARAHKASSIGIKGESLSGTAGDFYTNTGTSLRVNAATTGKAIIVDGGNSGFGAPNPQEKLDVNGAVKIGNTTSNNAGTIKYDGTDLQGYVGGQWKSLTAGGSSPFTTTGNNTYLTNVNNGTLSVGVNASLPTYKSTIYSDNVNPNGMYISANLGSGIAMTTSGRVGINTLSPFTDAVLDVNGDMYIRGGNPGSGKVLTSNADGKTSWQTPSGGVNYSAGNGINISGGNVISTVPQTLSIATNQLTLSNGGGTITLPSNSYSAGTGIAITGNTVNALNTTNIWNANKIQGNNVSTTTPTNGQSLVWNNTASQWEPQTVSGGGGGSSPWTVNGNDINNSNTGKVLVGDATGSTGAKFEVANNPGGGFGKVAAISTTSNYMTALEVTESSTSGNPAATVGSAGATAIKASATFGDALFAYSSNGRGIFLKGGSTNYPAMKIENNVNATTSLEIDGQIKINGGAPGAGKVLTSDANGLASWQTPSGGGGGGAAGWGLTGNSGNSPTTNFIGNTDAVDLVMKTNNVAGLVLTSGGAILASGNTSTGTTPAIGAGTRMMWIPNRAAFRAGAVNGTQWNDINIGFNSAAFGNNCIASGMNSFAAGSSSTAGSNTAISMGGSCSATSANTVALGNLVSVNQSGSFCFGDQEFANTLMPTTSNEMSMRFKGGYRLFTTSATTGGSAIGVTLAAGGNSWAQISDVRRKENFVPVNGEDFLNKIAKFNLTSWNYKGQDAKSFRHYGPMAQDFYAAFGNDQLGTIGNDTTITSGDFDGINFIAIQALEKRTSDLNNVNLKLQQENKMLLESIKSIKAEISSQKAELNTKLEMLQAILENSKVDKNELTSNK